VHFAHSDTALKRLISQPLRIYKHCQLRISQHYIVLIDILTVLEHLGFSTVSLSARIKGVS
ncbi:MAG: hypothetical protein MJY45_07270, partial [Bacteroidales bacterium]|nr:hypothetical protein [Bacteroidales bacterium]